MAKAVGISISSKQQSANTQRAHGEGPSDHTLHPGLPGRLTSTNSEEVQQGALKKNDGPLRGWLVPRRPKKYQGWPDFFEIF
jgi:hypothetical protein